VIRVSISVAIEGEELALTDVIRESAIHVGKNIFIGECSW
jgi:hypothetical protein